MEMSDKKLNPDGIHNWLAKLVSDQKYSYLLEGINDDDCAILVLENIKFVITTDFLNANPIAKELKICSNWDLGRLLVAANLSDLCGTGAKPIAMLTSLMFEKETLEISFKELIKGVLYELKKYNIPLVGGDTKLGNSNAFCGIAIGIEKKGMKLFTKNASKPGDLIWLSGEVGSVSAAVVGLSQKLMDAKWNKWAKKSLISPKIPLKKSMNVSREKIGHGGTDISDGLGENIYDLCDTSQVGAILYAEKIPVNKRCIEISKITKIPHWVFGLNIGGDFQFIVTGNRKHSKLFKKFGFYHIGEITTNQDKFLELENKNRITLPRIGHSDLKIKNYSSEVQDLINQALNELL